MYSVADSRGILLYVYDMPILPNIGNNTSLITVDYYKQRGFYLYSI